MTESQSIGAIIVTYNPEIERLTQNILAVLNQFNDVLIVDNCSQNINEIKAIAKNKNVVIIALDNNMGIAYAQNVGVKHYQDNGNKWVLMLDQDTIIPENTYLKMTNLPQFQSKTTGILGMRYLPREGDLDVHKVTRIIASGNLINIGAWDKVGGFDNDLFIDQVDFDFNYKLQLTGYDIWQIDSLKMKHDVGKQPTNIKYARFLSNLFNLNNITEHSEMRQYYIYRNSIIIRKRYPEFFNNIGVVKFTLKMIILSFAYEHPFKKITAALKGISEAIRYNPVKDDKFQFFKKSVTK
ncbi:glycosyltransferase [Periweissella fabaria]|uniref:Glycosyltransferase 2-like domain-containing protein n=1 Tax=Periweissella fabaria TaxID=546157 RepID=A0ABN8BLC4_9LACO|nr:glycosyltransferase [Periweissella fabaria]MCM0596585.1 glycosyltransferase [Periweissella fabaria]CAH0416490.1 hypothetical protein WFA24289_00794 [Periweissella fabaria]